MTQQVPSQTGTIARSAGTVSFAVFLSRILGLIREQVFAAMFGAGFAYDAYVVAFRIPNLLRDLFAEGALSAAFVTVFTDYKTKQDAAATWKLANNVIAAIIVVVGAITLGGMLLSGPLVSFMAPDFSLIPGKRELTTLMTSIMFPFLLLVSLSAVAMGILNSLGKFFIPSMASSFFNLGSILSGVLFSFVFSFFRQPPIIGMAVGTIIGGVLQVGVQLPELKRQGFSFAFYLQFKDAGLKRVMKLMLPAIIGLSATQINLFINTFFASSCPEGSVSWLNYAFRLIMFPIGVVGVSLSIATLPVVSVHASRGDTAQLRDAYVSSTVLSFLLTIPASVGLIFLATPIVCLIFQHGRFTALDTMNTAQALALYSAGLFAYASLKIIVPVFYALNKPRFPVIGSFITVCLNFIFVVLTLKTLEHRAIALSTSVSVIVNFLFLSIALYREIQGYSVRYLIESLVKISAVSFAMGAGALWLNTVTAHMAGPGLLAQLLALLAAMIGAAVFYFIAISFTGIKEINYLTARIRSRLKM
jgi:putative peptidoglycan lipid II flippase